MFWANTNTHAEYYISKSSTKQSQEFIRNVNIRFYGRIYQKIGKCDFCNTLESHILFKGNAIHHAFKMQKSAMLEVVYNRNQVSLKGNRNQGLWYQSRNFFCQNLFFFFKKFLIFPHTILKRLKLNKDWQK